MKYIRLYWLTCILAMLFVGVTAQATTIVMPTDEQLISKSPVIIEGTVLQSAPVDRDGRIWTETTVQVANVLKGTAGDTVTVRELGGVIDNRITKIFGAPEFQAGEHVLLFLTPTPRGDYQTTDLFVGKFTEEKMLDGRRLWARHDEAGDVVLLDHDFNPVHTGNVQREAVSFEKYVQDRVRGRQGTNNYGIENPVEDSNGATTGGRGSARANFTLISEPTVYRWFTFDNGGSANWYSYGTQPGYTGGGVNEIQTAMSAWNGYASAKIRYSYVGAMSSSPAGLQTPNGVNEVLFNDPLSEIAGTWNPSTGGVVGQGGFNGVQGSASWTAPFTADSTHTQRAYTAYNIVEGNLTIQDNVSPGQGISSSRLAEIVAHEFGHTLGLGHSTDSTALMYPTVTGLGPSLRADDQTAARWLYPNGSAPPPPTVTVPAAPSGLTATVSGTSAVLHWVDNASNETGQSIYVAPPNGAYQKITDVAAGTTQATLSGFSAGTYRIYVVSFNSAGTSPASNVATVTIAAAVPLVASFGVNPASGIAGQTTFSFADQSTGGVTAWMWTFGDGSTSAAQNPGKVYNVAGAYTVTLTVYRNQETAAASRTIIVSNAVPVTPAPNAAFDFSPGAPHAGDSVSFFDRSGGSPTSWSWSFGDGGTSNAASPSHVFGAPGNYTVVLTVTNSAGSSTASHGVSVSANPQTYRSLIPATAQTNGVGGSVWRTELTIFNAGSDVAVIQLTFIPGNGGSVLSRTITIGGHQSSTFANTLTDLFGLSSGAGALAVESTGAASMPDLRVSSRTFTTGATGTYGQAVPAVAAADLDPTLYLTGLVANSAYRTNVGIVNRSNSPATANLVLTDVNGGVVGSTSVSVPANNFQQSPLSSYFPAVSGRSFDALSMRVTVSAPSAVSVYASVIDNRTQDPIYISGSKSATGSSMVIPAVGRVPGANGTFWRSDVTIFNPGNGMSVGLRYLAAGADNRSAGTQNIFIGGGQTVVLDDVAGRLGISSGTGALQLSWSGSSAPVVTTRTYTPTDGGGTFGQSVDPIGSWGRDSFLAGLRSDSSFRSNIGFVNSASQPISIAVSLLSSNGSTMATNTIGLAPQSQMQYALNALFPGVNPATVGNFTVQAHTDSAATLFVYGSMIDNSSGDPVFVAGR